mmetsp:Transcript_17246/g.41914  ORF Transcript_17246/g.41914 Transcript_17246/m.41914 type:complete len:274 (+) Transcript_17246:114-935(+)
MTNSTATTTSAVVIQLGSAAAAAATNGNAGESSPLVLKVTDMADAKSELVESSVQQLDIIVESSEFSDMYKPMELATLVPYLLPEGVVSVKVVNPSSSSGGSVDLQPVHTSFLLAGLKGVSEKREQDGSRVLTASLNPVRAASAPLRIKTNAVVTIDLDGGGGDDDEMIDEDDLLNSDLLAPPPAMNEIATASAGDDDCAGRKPCDNCTCGRAEEADAAAGSDKMMQKKNAPSSSCGKCHLGDAFRCASCPYLGKPAFKAGEEHVVLQMTDDL